ncbi:MAG: glycosyltransferase [Bacteroidota bacterium]|nr:glycosyltransferase [Bacteroidota bacterium]
MQLRVLSIIIPTYKRLTALTETYNSLTAAITNIDAEIIIVNNDPDYDLNDLRNHLGTNEPPTLLLNNRSNSAASARNLGAGAAKGQMLLFMDDDVIINNKNIARILEIHNIFDNILLSPTWEYTQEIENILESSPYGRFRLKYDYPATVPRGTTGRNLDGRKDLFSEETLSSFCLSMRNEIYQDLNGMDENFPFAGCEDQEFTMRAKKKGYRLILDESNVVYHNESHRLDPDIWLKRQYSGVQGFVYLCLKFPERRKSPLWTENIPMQNDDPLRLRLKKVAKSFMRNQQMTILFNHLIRFCEWIHIPEPLLFRLYLIQAGIYLNKGFAKSYKECM